MLDKALVLHARPPEGRSGIIAYVDLCPEQDPVLANQIYSSLYNVSLKFKDMASACSKDIIGACCDFALINSQTEH